MTNKKLNNIAIENAKIIFRNFSGKETKFNRSGNRNFCVFIDDEGIAKQMENDGWNLRILEPRDEGDVARAYLPVTVNFTNIPPKIYLVTTKAKIELDEESVGTLDYAEIRGVDLVVRPYIWEVNGKSGVKAYLKTMYVAIDEDEFAHKYEMAEENYEDLPF